MATTAIASTLVGCVGCQAGVEFLQKRFDANLSLVTLAQFAFVVVAKLLTSRFEVWTGQKIPTRAYLKIVAIVFVVNLCNNSSIGYGVHFPLFIIFKSGSLLANMLLGILLRGYHYSVREIYSVLLVTGGVIIFTIASYDSTSPVHSEVKFDETDWTRLLAVPPFIIVPSMGVHRDCSKV
ncbi:hypothetical protein WR25_21854 [Diploscapter pachys]|uniref:Uncharacterized protein n=1 Tax=Diploscapter pachys TaxID=2018661 RepID=A0A2A2LCQ9_9BILA|nr:hypothetical protein WR25_21854 [Diploscapter pachys]